METTNTTSTKASDERKLCVKCDMFYGTSATNFMCSKCFKEDQQKKGVVKEDTKSNAKPSKATGTDIKLTSADTAASKTPEEEKQPSRPVQEQKNRCWYCNKKTGLLGFDCKCGYIFCSKHRHADDHKCDYDFKKDDIEKLRKQNPLLTGEKIGKIV